MEHEIKNKQNRQDFNRIINRMIRQNEYRLKIDQATGTAQEVIDEYKENIKFLEDLRDGKLELNQ